MNSSEQLFHPGKILPKYAKMEVNPLPRVTVIPLFAIDLILSKIYWEIFHIMNTKSLTGNWHRAN
jgi:hypothetical protein